MTQRVLTTWNEDMAGDVSSTQWCRGVADERSCFFLFCTWVYLMLSKLFERDLFRGARCRILAETPLESDREKFGVHLDTFISCERGNSIWRSET